jgi:TolA-binding protein
MVLLFSSFIQAKDVLKINEDLVRAYQNFIKLRITDGYSYTSLSKLKDPNNALVYYIENYADFFTLFIGEELQEYNRRIENKEKRLKKIKSADPDTPYYLFAQAEILLQWAVIKIKFDDKISAAGDVLEAYNLLIENRNKYPDFYPNQKSLSIIHALAESLPPWVRKIVGVKGSVSLGVKEIKDLVQKLSPNKDLFYEESIAIYAYILFYADNKKELAYQTLIKNNLDHKTNPLITFLKATMAQKTGRNEDCIRFLQQKPTGGSYLPFYYLDFMYGKALLYKLDKTADQHILKFLKNFKGRHYLKEAYQKLAWHHLAVQNDLNAYKLSMQFALTKGSSTIDEDKQAYQEAKSHIVPDRALLQSRLLYDGGYYERAKNLLLPLSKKYSFGENSEEFQYRMGRINESLKDISSAIVFYKNTINLPPSKRYFACSAALQLGLLYETKGQNAEARKYFQKCLTMTPYEYAESIHAKAKAGINRVSK